MRRPSRLSQIGRYMRSLQSGVRNIGHAAARARDYFLNQMQDLGGDDGGYKRRQFLRTFQQKGRDLANKNARFETFRNDSKRGKNQVARLAPQHLGKLFLFSYDPKHKETLPYYDTVPLVMLFTIENDRFRGLNFHYLPPPLRAQLMDAIVDNQIRHRRFSGNDDTEDTMRFNYNVMKRAAKSGLYKPCVKEYLFKHVVSDRFLQIPGSEWEEVLFLPFQRFVKKSAEEVWAESKRRT